METIILIVLAIYLLVSIFLHLDGRAAVALALALLFMTALILVRGNSDLANQMAIYAYLMLVAGLFIILIEYLKLVPVSFSIKCRAFFVTILSVIISWILLVLFELLAKLNAQNISSGAVLLTKRLEVFIQKKTSPEEENHTTESLVFQEDLKKKNNDTK